jgi:hypothetical protein
MTDKSQSKIHSVFSLIILLLLTLIIGNLMYNIQHLDIPPDTRFPYPDGGGGEAAVLEVEGSGEGLRWFFIGVMVFLSGIAIVGFVVSTALRKSMISHKEIVAYLSVTAFLVIFFLVLPDIINSIRALMGGHTPTDGGGNGGGGEGADISFGFPIGGILILIMALVVVLYFMVSRSLASMRAGAKEKEIQKDKREMLRYVEDAIADLELGRDPRDAIIRCYRNLCTLLAGKGISPRPHLTPREFERLVMARTGLKGKDLNELTGLFEEARYSTHELTDMDREEAVRCLKNFRSDVEGIGGVGSNVRPG